MHRGQNLADGTLLIKTLVIVGISVPQNMKYVSESIILYYIIPKSSIAFRKLILGKNKKTFLADGTTVCPFFKIGDDTPIFDV